MSRVLNLISFTFWAWPWQGVRSLGMGGGTPTPVQDGESMNISPGVQGPPPHCLLMTCVGEDDFHQIRHKEDTAYLTLCFAKDKINSLGINSWWHLKIPSQTSPHCTRPLCSIFAPQLKRGSWDPNPPCRWFSFINSNKSPVLAVCRPIFQNSQYLIDYLRWLSEMISWSSPRRSSKSCLS